MSWVVVGLVFTIGCLAHWGWFEAPELPGVGDEPRSDDGPPEQGRLAIPQKVSRVLVFLEIAVLVFCFLLNCPFPGRTQLGYITSFYVWVGWEVPPTLLLSLMGAWWDFAAGWLGVEEHHGWAYIVFLKVPLLFIWNFPALVFCGFCLACSVLIAELAAFILISCIWLPFALLFSGFRCFFLQPCMPVIVPHSVVFVRLAAVPFWLGLGVYFLTIYDPGGSLKEPWTEDLP